MAAPTTLRTETADGVRSIVLCRAAEYNTITPAFRDELAAEQEDRLAVHAAEDAVPREEAVRVTHRAA